MFTVELFAGYLYVLKYIATALAVLMLVSGLDDLIIDMTYWYFRLKRYMTIYRRHGYMAYRKLYEKKEQPLAIMVPAWRETGVIGAMAHAAASTLDYENYHIFVGTYPNDPDTQRDLDEVLLSFPNIHKVVCARPGPTSKADCLNNVLDAIFQFEKNTNIKFAGFILHDAEDVLSPQELKLFNYLVDKNDLIQIPVYPFEREWTNFTSMTYIDEFSELHAKDVPVREYIAGQVPSAGVGTCFSRKAVSQLLLDGDGIAFDVKSLTEDYDIGLRLHEKGMRQIFVRFAVIDPDQDSKRWLQGKRAPHVICVREYFPDKLMAAVRQKSRWIVGIIYQGYKTHRWTGSFRTNYFLWRDRKGVISNFVSFLATLVFLQLLGLWLYQQFWPGAWRFMSIFTDDWWLVTLLWINLGLMINRIFQRIFFVTTYYGLRQGLLSILRLFWANLINFLANWRALRQVVQHGDPKRVAWDKTTHDFPSLEDDVRSLKSLGQIMLDKGYVTATQLSEALEASIPGLRLGGKLLAMGFVTAEQLAECLAIQAGVTWETVPDCDRIAPEVLALVPARTALRYGVLPIRLEGDTLVLAREERLDPVSHAALQRRLGRSVSYFIAPRGQVVVSLRHLYGVRSTVDIDPVDLLQRVVAKGMLAPERARVLFKKYVETQLFFGEILGTLGYITRPMMNSLLMVHESSDMRFGEFLVAENLIDAAQVDHTLQIQQKHQLDMETALLEAGLSQAQIDIAKSRSAPAREIEATGE